ncbi:hypothetical protein RI129_005379 [Pyrocoelia pectoralis]|uniref:Cytochrome P450 n=1 Tax=Pyrocoelia pectoralis TaxID=417401 RepID=A0AAN7VE30_9COLE
MLDKGSYYSSERKMILLISGIITLTCTYALIQYFKKKYKYWESRNVPYEKPTMFFGSFLRFCFEKDNLRKYLDRTGIKFDSPYYGFFVFSRPILVINDIDIVKRIMIKDFASFPNKLFFSDKNCDPVFNNSLFNTRGEEWKSIRYKLSPVFTSGKLKVMFSLIRECSESLISYLEKMLDKDVEVTDVLSKFSTDVIASCAFGVKCNCFKMEMSDFQYYGENIFSKGTIGIIKNLSYIFVHSIVKIFKYSYLNPNAVRYFRKVFQEVVKERTTHNLKRNDFVDILLDLKRNETKFEKFVFDDERMLAQAIPFFAAGQETTTALVSFTLHELSLNNAIQKRLRQEIVDTVNKYGDISYEALKDMKYLKMVVSGKFLRFSYNNYRYFCRNVTQIPRHQFSSKGIAR